MASIIELTAATPQATQPLNVPASIDSDIFSFIEKGIRETPNAGNRNNYCHVYASDANRFGIDENETFYYLSKYACKDFTQAEIKQAIHSAYQRTNEHGIKEYIPMAQKKTLPAAGKPAANKLDEFDQWRITDKTNIPIPKPLILINNEIITTSDALTVISGPSKSGKTALESVCIAGSITNSPDYDGFEGIDILPNKEKKAVIHFDTEQSRWNHQQKHKTILQRANFNSCPEYFLSYNIRKLDISQYSTITKNICDAAKNQFNGIHSVWVDGGADYISDVNDAIQSNALVKFFDDLASDYSCPVIIILHTNPGGEKERGHFGSQCQRKAEAIITVKNDKDISYIEAKLLRHAGKGDVPQIQFVFDKSKGYHIVCGTRENMPVDSTQKNVGKITKLCNDVFVGQKSLSYGDVVKSIMGSLYIKDRAAKEYFATINAAGLITQGDDKLWRKV